MDYSIDIHGEDDIIVGELNSRYPTLETALKVRGMKVKKVINKDPRAQVVVESEPSFLNRVRKDGVGYNTLKSNPDIAIVQTHEATAHVNTQDWGSISDNRPVTFTIKTELKLRELRRIVAKSLFFASTAIKESQTH